MGRPFLLTPQGFERQMATNHLGHAALAAALRLLDTSASRVVVVSSTEARGGQLSPHTAREQLVTRRRATAEHAERRVRRPARVGQLPGRP